jgi:hypothetical protein
MEGKWLFTVHTFMGDMMSHYDIKVAGDKLEGTSSNPMGAFEFDAVRE